jgi:hypothetical protein
VDNCKRLRNAGFREDRPTYPQYFGGKKRF